MAYVLALALPLADLLGAISTTQEKLPMPWNKFGRYVHPEHQRAREAFRDRPWINAPSSELTPEQVQRAVEEGDLPARYLPAHEKGPPSELLSGPSISSGQAVGVKSPTGLGQT